MRERVLFRADSSSSIGTGHIMRDLVLAKREFGESEVLFAVRDLPGNINGRIREAGYALRLLESDDIEELVELVKRERIDTVVIDHYGIDAEMEKRLKEATGVMLWALDDTYERHYCDIVLNHNPYAESKSYRGLVSPLCEIRCGERYTLIRDEFVSEKSANKREKLYDILIAMGGSDEKNISMEILASIDKEEKFRIAVLTTSSNPNIDLLKEYIRNRKKVSLHIDTREVARMMSEPRLGIFSASVVANEALYLGMDFIAIESAQNQKEMAKYLAKKGIEVLKDSSLERLEESCTAILKSLERK